MALAERKRVAVNSTVPPADVHYVREGTRSNSPTTNEYDSPLCDADMPTGWVEGDIPKAIDANIAHQTRSGAFVHGQVQPASLPLRDSAHVPVSSHRGHGWRAGVAGSGGGSSAGRAVGGSGLGFGCRHQKSRSQAAPSGRSKEEEEEEEDRLVASIARLDTLLREERGDTDERDAPPQTTDSSNPIPIGKGCVRTELLKNGGENERKPARLMLRGISKSRVRGRSGKATNNCNLAELVPIVVPKPGLNHVVPVKAVVSSIPAIDTARDGTDNMKSIGPGMFPPLFSQVPTAPGARRDRGRYILADAGEVDENSVQEAATHIAHYGVVSPLPYQCAVRDGQRRPAKRDSVYTEVVHEHRSCENSRGGFTSASCVAGSSDRYGKGALASRRCTVRRQMEWLQQTPRSPGRHPGARYGDDPERLHHIGDVSEFHDDRVAAFDSRSVRDWRAGRGVLAGKSRPDEHQNALHHDRGGSSGWDRCDLSDVLSNLARKRANSEEVSHYVRQVQIMLEEPSRDVHCLCKYI